MESIKGVFSGDEEAKAQEAEAQAGQSTEQARVNCRSVPVEREFRRPIAYDVDYVYKGTKYRSRLAEDPGNRLRIRISVMPYVPTVPPIRGPRALSLALRRSTCEDSPPMKMNAHAHADSAARQASGMTSRARRPESCS